MQNRMQYSLLMGSPACHMNVTPLHNFIFFKGYSLYNNKKIYYKLEFYFHINAVNINHIKTGKNFCNPSKKKAFEICFT